MLARGLRVMEPVDINEPESDARGDVIAIFSSLTTTG
jgi:hypothetical protein|tara:strand:- start:2353 stop:2463 length:111 start_codon:yes stop_codon:yes gene_type:complete